jgi:hypothetical protein
VEFPKLFFGQKFINELLKIKMIKKILMDKFGAAKKGVREIKKIINM